LVLVPYRTLQQDDLDERPILAKAASAGFALIATADGAVAVGERARLARWLAGCSRRFALQQEALSYFDELCAQLMSPDGERVRLEAKALIGSACETAAHRQVVLSAARAAIVADQCVDEREEIALREICELLELDPECG
jgi:tellurite resistance protein